MPGEQDFSDLERSNVKTAILGATGLVGRTMLECLSRRPWVTEPPLLLASERSEGQALVFRGESVPCRDASRADLAGVRIALFSAGAAASRQYAPPVTEAGAWVVDNSSAFRLEPQVPLVVPEINPELVPRLDGREVDGGGIIANPNCSTIQIALALAPLHEAFGLQEVHVTTLQSVSGAGQRGLDELERSQRAEAAGQSASTEVFGRPVAGNVIPAIGCELPDGSYEEETKVVRELRKILDAPSLVVTCTATRVPVAVGHSAAVRAVLDRPVDSSEAAAAMAAWPGLAVATNPHDFLTPREIAGQTIVHVGRLRTEPARGDAVLFWVVADNLLKGAAWNAVQIADLLASA